MADVADAMVRRVVEKRNLNEVVALLKMQIESLAGHGHPRPYSLVQLVSLLLPCSSQKLSAVLGSFQKEALP